MNMDQVWALVRTVISFGAGILVTRGYVSADQANILTGAAVSAIPVLWSIWTHTHKGVTANPVAAVKAAVTK